MNLIWFFLRASWLVVVLAVFTGLLSGSSMAGLIALINNVVSSNNTSTNHLTWSFVELVLIVLISTMISKLLLIHLSQEAIYKLRIRLTTGILSSPLIHLEKIGANRLLATLITDVDSVSNALVMLPPLCIEIAFIVGCFIYLYWLSGSVFLIIFILIVVAVFIFQLILNKAKILLAITREEQDRLFKHFGTIIEGIKELKLHSQRRQAFLSEELQCSATAYRHHNIVSLTMFATVSVLNHLLFFTIISLLLFGLPHLISINPSTLSGYVLTITYLMTSITSLLDDLPIINRARVALQKIEVMGLSLASNSEAKTHIQLELKHSWKHLELSSITHAYQGDQEESHFTLGPIDLTFHPGELVFLVGGNGSGKSTLAKLITGLYIPESGEIWLDHQLITNENREWYRQHFSAVFSDFYLFERLFGLVSPDLDAQIQHYLVKLQLENKVQIKDRVFSTTNLSQGQRKRLALLTTYLEDRPLYLFDEWASDQDPLFKELFYKQLLPEMKNRGKTVLVISHDDRYFHLADRIVKLDYGKLEYDKYQDK
ncbi:ABC transporter ATP-binding protein [Nostocales cyanobacterium HT-58-2]|nr:ABC transporter ATP-binding protein [Nostocales cyanobacterium HT-58-2]